MAPSAQVCQYVASTLSPPSGFRLSSTVAPRAFMAEDASQTLRELGLAPSAILVVLPVRNQLGRRWWIARGHCAQFSYLSCL